MTNEPLPPRRLGRSAVALLAGLVTVIALSLATDQLLHMLGVYPPWGEPMHAAIALNLGPAWYPIALVVTALPCGWLGGVLHRGGKLQPRSQSE